MLSLPFLFISEGFIEIKINLIFYFHTSLWCLERFYENKNLSQFFLFVREWDVKGYVTISTTKWWNNIANQKNVLTLWISTQLEYTIPTKISIFSDLFYFWNLRIASIPFPRLPKELKLCTVIYTRSVPSDWQKLAECITTVPNIQVNYKLLLIIFIQ